MAERGDLVSQIVNGESEDDIEEDTNSEVELLETIATAIVEGILVINILAIMRGI